MKHFNRDKIRIEDVNFALKDNNFFEVKLKKLYKINFSLLFLKKSTIILIRIFSGLK